MTERAAAIGLPDARRIATSVAAYLVVFMVVLATVCGVILAAGRAPLPVLRVLIAGSIGSPTSLADSAAQAIPLLFTGLAVTLAFRCGIWNIGAEGQFLVGMLGAAAIGLATTGWNPVAGITAALLSGTLAGAAWAAMPAGLRALRGVPEVISTILFNFLAAYLLSYLVQGPLQERGTDVPRTPLLPTGIWLPNLLERSDVHAGLLVGVAAALGIHVILSRTTWGLQIRAVGLGPVAARAVGVPITRVASAAFIASGAIAGLGGAVHALGVAHQLYIYEPGEPGFGYTGVAVALLGGQTAVGTIIAALFFGGLAAGSNTIQREAGVHFQLAYVIQALLIIALLVTSRRHV